MKNCVDCVWLKDHSHKKDEEGNEIYICDMGHLTGDVRVKYLSKGKDCYYFDEDSWTGG